MIAPRITSRTFVSNLKVYYLNYHSNEEQYFCYLEFKSRLTQILQLTTGLDRPKINTIATGLDRPK